MEDEDISEDIMSMSTEDIRMLTRQMEDQTRMFKSDIMTLQHETKSQQEAIKDNKAKIKMNKQLPYLVGNVIEILDVGGEDDGEEEPVKGAKPPPSTGGE